MIFQSQAALMSLPGFLAQTSNMGDTPTPSLVSLQLATSTTTPILTAPMAPALKGNGQPAVNAGVKTTQPTILQTIQPRWTSPPIKVPHYTANHHSNSQVWS
jgi:hypothetical protein